jgi:hypothetical protein
MKNKIKTLLFCAIALISATPWTVSKAQNSVVDHASITSKNLSAIVREYEEDSFVLYTHDGFFSRWFNLVDMYGAVITDVQLPTTLTINDFEILDGMVYFCGADNTSPIIGWFNVDSVFNSYSTIRYVIVPPNMPCPDNTSAQDIISKLIRITPTKFGGQVHLLLTGEGSCGMTTTLNHCLIDLYHDGMGWVMVYHQQNTGIYYYDDIEVTSNNVVIVGHKNESNGEYIQEYMIPTIPNQDIFLKQTLPGNTYFSQLTYAHGVGADYIPDMYKEILSDKMVGDMFVTVAYGTRFAYPNTDTGTFLNIYYSAGNLASRWFIQKHCWSNNELRYNSATNSIMLFLNNCYSTWREGYIEFFLDNSHTIVTSAVFHHENAHGMYKTLDACENSLVNGKTVLIGTSPTHCLRIWQHIDNPTPLCTSDTILSVISIPLDGSSHTQEVHYLYQLLSTNQILPRRRQSKLTKVCVEKNQ